MPMPNEIVPTGDPRCDICAGDRERPRPGPGERFSARELVSTMCEACRDELLREVDRMGRVEQHEMRRGDAADN